MGWNAPRAFGLIWTTEKNGETKTPSDGKFWAFRTVFLGVAETLKRAEPLFMGLGRDLERVKGIEPSYAAWEAAVLPLNYTRSG